MKFVWLEVPGGGQVPVNPDQVAYLRKTTQGPPALVFGAVQGGFHELMVVGEAEAIVAALEGAGAGPAAPPEAAPQPRAGKTSRASAT